MTLRWQRRELEAARAFGKQRQHRLRFQSAPDVEPIELASGILIQLEVKSRAKLPGWLTKAFEQALRYSPRAIPVAILSERGGSAIAALPLTAFAHIAGVDPGKVGG